MIRVIWDLPDDPKGNVCHIEAHGISQDEVEEVVTDPANDISSSRASGEPITFGYTSSGRYIAVVWQHVDDDPLTVYPITAYEVDEPRPRHR